MNMHLIRRPAAGILIAVLSVFALVHAQADRDAVKERMKGRYAKITELKKAGKIGETPLGFLETVKPAYGKEADIGAILTGENNDRKLLYDLISRESETPADEVGMSNAKRIFQKAPGTDYFKDSDDAWKQKKEMTPSE